MVVLGRVRMRVVTDAMIPQRADPDGCAIAAVENEADTALRDQREPLVVPVAPQAGLRSRSGRR